MGYRSDIYIKIKAEKAFETKAFLESWETLHGLKDEYTRITDTNYIYIKIIGWKFYNSYPGVASIINFIESLSEDAGMITIGEDGVTEQWGDTDEVELYTTTSIEGFTY